MSTVDVSGRKFVVAWIAKRQPLFLATDDWQEARLLFERKARELRRWRDEPARRYGELIHLGHGVDLGQVAVFNAHQLGDATAGPSAFWRIYAEGGPMPVIGPVADVGAFQERLQVSGVVRSSQRYRAAAEVDLVEKREPPSEALASPKARLALARVLKRPDQLKAHIRGLEVGEILWIGHQLRTQDEIGLAHDVVRFAGARGVTPGRLNLEAAIFRDLQFFDRSRDLYLESLELESSGEFNPYGHVGLAATLRRLGKPDEAYHHLKIARRYYPDDRYVIETLDAVMHDFAARAA